MKTVGRNVNQIKPYFIEDLLQILRSIAFSAGKDVHPEFIRALLCVALAVGLTEKDLIGD